MTTKSVLKILGSILLLLSVFGYLFPKWGKVDFTNNENLFYLLTALVALFFAQFNPRVRKTILFIFAIAFLILGLYGFTLKHPTDFRIGTMKAQLDLIDNLINLGFGLAFAWFGFQHAKRST